MHKGFDYLNNNPFMGQSERLCLGDAHSVGVTHNYRGPYMFESKAKNTISFIVCLNK